MSKVGHIFQNLCENQGCFLCFEIDNYGPLNDELVAVPSIKCSMNLYHRWSNEALSVFFDNISLDLALSRTDKMLEFRWVLNVFIFIAD